MSKTKAKYIAPIDIDTEDMIKSAMADVRTGHLDSADIKLQRLEHARNVADKFGAYIQNGKDWSAWRSLMEWVDFMAMERMIEHTTAESMRDKLIRLMPDALDMHD